LISGIAQEIGLAAITGSFLVGVAMARASVARSLNDKISTIGHGLFIPLFFVYMGASTDLGALGGIGAMALGVVGVAIIDKLIGCGVGAKLGGMSWRDSLRVGVGMMPRAEVALVVASLGVGVGIVTSELLSITVLVVLVTSLITPVLVKWAFKGTTGQS
jgi:Kef-type K+ transport system membrane component KefB